MVEHLLCDRCGKKQAEQLEPFMQTSACLRAPLDLCSTCYDEYIKMFAHWQLELEKWLEGVK